MNRSLGEIETLAKRAARGAGLSWGLSDDAGRAVRWLASRQLPAADVFVALLDQNDTCVSADIAPVSLGGDWRARGGRLCPLSSGAALSDCADRLSSGAAIQMLGISFPLLVVPFAAWAALHIKAPITIGWDAVEIATDGHGILVSDPDRQIETASTARLRCTCSNQTHDLTGHPGLRGVVSEKSWETLQTFAHRTYAPATEASRLRGAGAGTSDND